MTLEVSLAETREGRHVPLSEEQADHLRRVLRMGAGDVLEVSDGAGWTASAELDQQGAVLTTDAVLEPAPDPALVVVHALPKGRKLDEVVRLLTELGVARIVPVEADHSVPRLTGEKAARAQQRWEAIARSAVDQARRPWVCDVDVPTDLVSALDSLAPARGIVGRVGATRSIGDAVEAWRGAAGPLVLAVGPEGGWSVEEVVVLEERGYLTISMGPTVLRTEHAAGILTGIVSYILGRMG